MARPRIYIVISFDQSKHSSSRNSKPPIITIQGLPRIVMKARLVHRGIPMNVIKSVTSLCSSRRATVSVNGFGTEPCRWARPCHSFSTSLSTLIWGRKLPTGAMGRMGFVDDYTRWTIDSSVEENMETPQTKVIPRPLKRAKEVYPPKTNQAFSNVKCSVELIDYRFRRERRLYRRIEGKGK